MIRVTLFGESNLPILSYDMLLDGCRSEVPGHADEEAP
jgi:hypothetical protein